MQAQNLIREILLEEFDSRKVNNPSYSLRMFARDAGVAPAALSSFMSGKRNFSKKMGVRICKALGIQMDIIFKIERTYDLEKSSKETSKEDIKKQQLQSQLYYLLTDPLYYSLLCLIETCDFQNDNIWIAQRLSTTESRIEKTKQTLINLEFIKVEDEKLIPLDSVLASTDNIPNHSLRIRHQRNMEDSKKAVRDIDVSKRYFAFETLSFDEEDFPIVQAKINQLMDDLIWLSKKGTNKTQVYEFCSHYFPRTNVD